MFQISQDRSGSCSGTWLCRGQEVCLKAPHQFCCTHSQHPACRIFLFDRKWAVLGDKVGDKHRLHKTGLLYNLPSNPQSVRLKSLCLCAFSDTNLLSSLFFIIPKEFVLLLNFNNLIVHHNRCRDFTYICLLLFRFWLLEKMICTSLQKPLTTEPFPESSLLQQNHLCMW